MYDEVIDVVAVSITYEIENDNNFNFMQSFMHI